MANSVPLALQRSFPQKALDEFSASAWSSEMAKCVLCETTRLEAEKAKACWLKVETPQLWASLRRAPEAMVSFQAAQATLRGA